MAFTGLQAIAGYYCNKYFIKFKQFSYTIILGILLPDIDIFFALLGSMFFQFEKSIFLFTNKATHSLCVIIIIYLFGLIFYELTKKKNITIITKGIIIGITLHIIIDVLFSNKNIFILWPLNLDFNLISNITLSKYYSIIQVFDFMFFRLYGWFIIEKLIISSSNEIIYLKLINKWMKIEFLFFLIMIILLLLNVKYFSLIWMLLFSPSIMIALFFTYVIRNQF